MVERGQPITLDDLQALAARGGVNIIGQPNFSFVLNQFGQPNTTWLTELDRFRNYFLDIRRRLRRLLIDFGPYCYAEETSPLNSFPVQGVIGDTGYELENDNFYFYFTQDDQPPVTIFNVITASWTLAYYADPNAPDERNGRLKFTESAPSGESYQISGRVYFTCPEGKELTVSGDTQFISGSFVRIPRTNLGTYGFSGIGAGQPVIVDGYFELSGQINPTDGIDLYAAWEGPYVDDYRFRVFNCRIQSTHAHAEIADDAMHSTMTVYKIGPIPAADFRQTAPNFPPSIGQILIPSESLDSGATSSGVFRCTGFPIARLDFQTTLTNGARGAVSSPQVSPAIDYKIPRYPFHASGTFLPGVPADYEKGSEVYSVRAIRSPVPQGDNNFELQAADDMVSGIKITARGHGFTVAPQVTLTGDCTRQATAEAAIQGPVIRIDVTDGGQGYSAAPTVQLFGSAWAGGSAVAVLSGGAVDHIDLIDGGYWQNGAPLVSISGGGGSGALATAVIDGKLDYIKITHAGSGYVGAPTVEIEGGIDHGASAIAFIGRPELSISIGHMRNDSFIEMGVVHIPADDWISDPIYPGWVIMNHRPIAYEASQDNIQLEASVFLPIGAGSFNSVGTGGTPISYPILADHYNDAWRLSVFN